MAKSLRKKATSKAAANKQARIKELEDEVKHLRRDADRVRKYRREAEHAKREHAAAEVVAKETELLLRDFHHSNFEMPTQKARRAKSGESKVIMAFGDTHGCSLDLEAWRAFLDDVRDVKPDVIIRGGDVLDCDGWLAQHHTTNYVAQTSYSYADEVIAANTMLDQLQAAAPQATIEIIEGNHDLRIETWALTTTQKHRLDAQFLLDIIGPQRQLNIKERGIKWWSRGECHDDAVAGGTIKRGMVYFTHPQRRGGKHAASTMASSFGRNTVYFHVHRRDYACVSNIKGEEFGAWCPGCMCVKRKYWHHTDHFGHTQGYHLQTVKPNGKFFGFNVPIIDGESYLSDLLR